jgi:hypothetical protein
MTMDRSSDVRKRIASVYELAGCPGPFRFEKLRS